MNFYASNLAIIRVREPSLARRLENTRDDPSVKIAEGVRGPVGVDVSLQNGSVIRFRREEMPPNVRRIAEKKLFSFSDVIILLGMGLGDTLAETLRSSAAGSFILLIEPNISFFRKLIERFDLADVLSDPRLSLSVGEEPVRAVMGRFEEKFGIFTRPNFQVIKHGLSVSCNTEYYQKVDEVLARQKEIAELNLDSIGKLSGMWHANIMANLRGLMENPGIINLFGKFTGIPAVIVSAGPSLEKNCVWLRKAKDRMVVICVDTALKTLLRNGVTPHLVVSVDALFENYTHLADVDTSAYTLIVNPVTYPRILSEHGGDMFVTGYTDPLVKWLEKLGGELGENITGGSVATAAFDLAARMGCSPLILTGQDLAFTGGRTHSGGGAKQEMMFGSVGHPNPNGMINRWLMEDEEVLEVAGNLGHRLESSKKMNAWKTWFEIRIEDGNIKCLNATEGGAEIKGAAKRCLKEIVLEGVYSKVDVRRMIREARPVKPTGNFEMVKKRLHAVAERVREVKRICSLGIQEAQKVQAEAQRKGEGVEADNALKTCMGYMGMLMKEGEFLEINRWRFEKNLDAIQRLQSKLKFSDRKKQMFINAESCLLFFREAYRIGRDFEKNFGMLGRMEDRAGAERSANVCQG